MIYTKMTGRVYSKPSIIQTVRFKKIVIAEGNNPQPSRTTEMGNTGCATQAYDSPTLRCGANSMQGKHANGF